MILEIAMLSIRPGQQTSFESAFAKAERLLPGMRGYLSHELQRSIECEGHYALLVDWLTPEDSILRFRKSNEFDRWLELTEDYLAEPPQVQIFRAVDLGRPDG